MAGENRSIGCFVRPPTARQFQWAGGLGPNLSFTKLAIPPRFLSSFKAGRSSATGHNVLSFRWSDPNHPMFIHWHYRLFKCPLFALGAVQWSKMWTGWGKRRTSKRKREDRKRHGKGEILGNRIPKSNQRNWHFEKRWVLGRFFSRLRKICQKVKVSLIRWYERPGRLKINQ